MTSTGHGARHSRLDGCLDVDHPEHGKVRVAASPVQFSNEPPSVRNHAPEIGADTETVLLEAGLTWEEMGPLKEQGVIS